MNEFTETTLEEAGWYFFYPQNPGKFGRPKYVELEQCTIRDGDLHCKAYAGVYIGPIIPPKPVKEKGGEG